MSIMSINVVKKHPDNEITFSDISVVCGELKVVGSRREVIFCTSSTRSVKVYVFVVGHVQLQTRQLKVSIVSVQQQAFIPVGSVLVLVQVL